MSTEHEPTKADAEVTSAQTPDAPLEKNSNGHTNGSDVEENETADGQDGNEDDTSSGENKAQEDANGAESTGKSAQTPAKSAKRKSTSGVPEHKSRKSNKRKSIVATNPDLEPGDYVWARLKGYPPWPAVICSESMIPATLLGKRPVSARFPNGTWREDFENEGKSAKDRTFPVMFLHTNEFSWMVNTTLTRLKPEECEVKEGGKKMSADLKVAYEVATQGHDLEHFQNLLDTHAKETQEYEDELRERAEKKAAKEQEKAAKADKKNENKATNKEQRKSNAAETNNDAMDVDEEVEGAEEAEGSDTKQKSSKKRKKDVDSEGEGPKPKKTPKVKLTTKEPKSATKNETSTATGSAKKTKAKKPSKDAPAAPAMTEEERLAAREKHIFYLRHRLQKSFLTADVAPNPEDMSTMSEHFDQLEKHKDIEPEIIKNTKIHKVLKQILKLASIPKDLEFKFRERATNLLGTWNEALSTLTDNGITPVAESKDGDKTEKSTEKPEGPTKSTKAKGNDHPENEKEDHADGQDDGQSSKSDDDRSAEQAEQSKIAEINAGETTQHADQIMADTADADTKEDSKDETTDEASKDKKED